MSGAYYNEYDGLFRAYLVTNVVTGKQYVGVTSKTVSRRWSNHIAAARAAREHTALGRAIRKYGPESFNVVWVASARNWSAVLEVERLLVSQWGTKGPHGYNMTDGGLGAHGLLAEIRERVVRSNLGRKHTEEAKRKIGRASRGHVVTEEQRAKIRAKHIGKTLSAEHRQKLALSKLGKKLPPRSPEHSARISDGLRRAWKRRRSA